MTTDPTPPTPETRVMPQDLCPICWRPDTFRMPPDWQDRVDRGQTIPIVGCGNPWHYIRDALTRGLALTGGAALIAAERRRQVEAVERCPPGQHDWEVRHPGDLASCRVCWFVETDTDHPTPAPDASAP